MSADAATKENKALAWLRTTPVNTALNFSLPLKTWHFIPAELLLLLLLFIMRSSDPYKATSPLDIELVMSSII